MGRIWRVFIRDWQRILRVPQAWIIVVGVIVTPSMYAWVNILAFWDPYDNTSQLSVAVTNQDEGATSDLTGPINIGDKIVAQLEENDQLGWTFVPEDVARQRVASGESAAAIIIPAQFSRDLLSITTASYTPARLQYLVNEKANAVAPKITDAGAEQLRRQINANFVSTVADQVATVMQEAAQTAQSRLGDIESTTLSSLDDATASVEAASADVLSVQTALESARDKLAVTVQVLDDSGTAVRRAQHSLNATSGLITDLQSALTDFVGAASSGYVDATTLLAQLSSDVQQPLGELTGKLLVAQGDLGSALVTLDTIAEANSAAADRIQDALDGGGLDPAVTADLQRLLDQLRDVNTSDAAVIGNLQELNDGFGGSLNDIAEAADTINGVLQGVAANSGNVRDLLVTTVPTLNRSLTALAGSSAGLAAVLDSQHQLLGEAGNLVSALDGQLVDLSSALTGGRQLLSGIETQLGHVRVDLVALSSASIGGGLTELTSLNADEISSFMASPVKVKEEIVFPVKHYGSSMAALFTNLSLWIGAFVLMVIFKLHADTEKIPELTPRQGYMGRWMFLASISAAQGLLVTVGNLVIGVQTANALVFVVTGMYIAVVYLSIIYALSITFGLVGKGLCVILVIMQIPGASGLYPIEMMPDFFQKLYPYFPFTYGIAAMREVISGFYGNHYVSAVATLGFFAMGGFILGLGISPHLRTFNRLFTREVADTDLMVVERPSYVRRYRLSQILRALSAGDSYRSQLQRQATAFMRRYPSLLRGGAIAGVAVPILLLLIGHFVPDSKAQLLGWWVAWFLLLIAYLVAVEYVRNSLESAVAVSELPQSQLQAAIARQDASISTTADATPGREL